MSKETNEQKVGLSRQLIFAESGSIQTLKHSSKVSSSSGNDNHSTSLTINNITMFQLNDLKVKCYDENAMLFQEGDEVTLIGHIEDSGVFRVYAYRNITSNITCGDFFFAEIILLPISLFLCFFTAFSFFYLIFNSDDIGSFLFGFAFISAFAFISYCSSYYYMRIKAINILYSSLFGLSNFAKRFKKILNFPRNLLRKSYDNTIDDIPQ